MLKLPGQMDAEQFLAVHWQKEPLFIERAVASLAPAITNGTVVLKFWLYVSKEEQKRRFAFFAEYEIKTDREIPVVILERRS